MSDKEAAKQLLRQLGLSPKKDKFKARRGMWFYFVEIQPNVYMYRPLVTPVKMSDKMSLLIEVDKIIAGGGRVEPFTINETKTNKLAENKCVTKLN